MSELLDKQVHAQEEKNFRGSRKLSQAHEKVCDENETKKQEKNDVCVKLYSWKEALYNAYVKNRWKRYA